MEVGGGPKSPPAWNRVNGKVHLFFEVIDIPTRL